MVRYTTGPGDRYILRFLVSLPGLFLNINHAYNSTFNRGFLSPLVKGRRGINHPGASYRGASSHAGAMLIWTEALRGNEVRRLIRTA
jgi:hypothetical protein